MASKNDVARGGAVKVRKVLAPEVASNDQLVVKKGASRDVTQLKAATKSRIEELKHQARKTGTFPSKSAASPTASTVATGTLAGKSVRNLRATTGVNKAVLSNSVKPNTTPGVAKKVAVKPQTAPAANAKPPVTKSLTAKQALAIREAQLRAAALKAGRVNNNQSVPKAKKPHTVTASPATAKRTNQQAPKSAVAVTAARSNPKQHADLARETAKQMVPVAAKPDSHQDTPKAKPERKPPIINATALLAAKYPNYFADNNDNRTKAETRTVFVISSMILSLIAFSWMNWNAINFQAEGDFTYNSGLIGGITMVIVLIYALRKRLKILRRAGNMEAWYYFHLFGGVLGPFVIIFHTGFTIKSINSGVALFTMITIVLSGVFGRYIYPRIGYSLHRKLLEMKDSESQLMEVLHSYESSISERIERRLSNFALSILTGQSSILKLPMRLLAIRGAAAACYVKVSNDLVALVNSSARNKGFSDIEVKARINREKEQLRVHIGDLANIAHAHLFERILVKWRILHIPLLYILVITSLFHVLAVHMY